MATRESTAPERVRTGAPAAAPVWTGPLLAALLAVNLGCLAIHLGSFALLGRVLESFNLDLERSIPTWWSSAQLLLAGLSLALVATRNGIVRPSASLVLGLFGLLLVLMSMDEVSTLHERAGIYLDRIVGDRRGTSFHLTGLWFVAIGVPFAIVVALMLRRLAGFLAEVPGTRLRLALGVAVLLAGAAGVEAIGNLVTPEGLGNRLHLDRDYLLVVALEEFLEMCGGSLLLWASLGFLRNHWSTRGVLGELRPLTEAEAEALRR